MSRDENLHNIKELTKILEEQLSRIKLNTITNGELLLLSEYHTKISIYKNANELPHDIDDMQKYLFMGMYVYKFLLQN